MPEDINSPHMRGERDWFKEKFGDMWKAVRDAAEEDGFVKSVRDNDPRWYKDPQKSDAVEEYIRQNSRPGNWGGSPELPQKPSGPIRPVKDGNWHEEEDDGDPDDQS